AQLVARPQTVTGLHVLVAHGEEREGTVGTQLRVAIDDSGPGGFHGAALGKIDLEPLSPGRFTVPGEETDSDAHCRAYEKSAASRGATAAAGRSVRWGVWGALSGFPR